MTALRCSGAVLSARQPTDYINFFDDKSGQAKQVKSGYIGVNHVRDLKGVLEREKAAIGALITLREPTKPILRKLRLPVSTNRKSFRAAILGCKS